MATVTKYATGSALDLPRRIADSFAEFGDLTAFGGEVLALTFRPPARGALVPALYTIGVRSIPVVAVTGLFIGMVLAVQSYAQFHAARHGHATRLDHQHVGGARTGSGVGGDHVGRPSRRGNGRRTGHHAHHRTDRRDGLPGDQSGPPAGGAALYGLCAVDSAADDPGQLHGCDGRRAGVYAGVQYQRPFLLAAIRRDP